MVDVDSVRDAIAEIYDPCSLFNGVGLSLVDMGLIDEISIDDGAVEVGLLLTMPTCLFFFDMARQIEEAVERLPGVLQVEVQNRAGNDVWTSDRMTEHARSQLEVSRRERIERLPSGPGDNQPSSRRDYE